MRGRGRSSRWNRLRGIYTGERPYPVWMKLLLVVPAVTSTVELHDRRGLAVAAVGALVWGWLLVSVVRGVSRSSAWSRAHPAADSVLVVPMIFAALAYLTRLELGWCALIGVAVWLVVLALGGWRRRSVYRGRAGIG